MISEERKAIVARLRQLAETNDPTQPWQNKSDPSRFLLGVATIIEMEGEDSTPMPGVACKACGGSGWIAWAIPDADGDTHGRPCTEKGCRHALDVDGRGGDLGDDPDDRLGALAVAREQAGHLAPTAADGATPSADASWASGVLRAQGFCGFVSIDGDPPHEVGCILQPGHDDNVHGAAAPSQVCPTFEEAWKVKEAAGYQYGCDALEQVRFGWEIRDAYVRSDLRQPGAAHQGAPRGAGYVAGGSVCASPADQGVDWEHRSGSSTGDVARRADDREGARLVSAPADGVVSASPSSCPAMHIDVERYEALMVVLAFARAAVDAPDTTRAMHALSRLSAAIQAADQFTRPAVCGETFVPVGSTGWARCEQPMPCALHAKGQER